MANPSVTYTFANSTTADATQVNTNFNDIINSLTDGTKSITIDALTCGGATTLNGAVTLGNGTPDDITISGSLASSIPIKTTFSYDLGSSTIGLKSVYFGSADSAAKSTRVIAGTVGTSYSLTLPPSAGGAGTHIRNNAGTLMALPGDPYAAWNFGIAASVGSNALTISLKGADGNDPSATNPVDITFRSSTAATGTPVTRQVTGALSITVNASATLGHASGKDQYVWVYAIDNAGTVELAVSGVQLFNSGSIQSSTSISAAATSGTTLYSTTGRSNVGIRLLGRILSNQATAGTWASAPSELSINPLIVPNITDWASFTPTGSWVANTTYTGQWRRVGDSMEVQYKLSLSGAPTATALTLNVPNSQSIDTTKSVSSVTRDGFFSSGTADDGSAPYLLWLEYTTTTAFIVRVGSSDITYTYGSTVTNTIPFTFGASDYVVAHVRVPILGWSTYGP